MVRTIDCDKSDAPSRAITDIITKDQLSALADAGWVVIQREYFCQIGVERVISGQGLDLLNTDRGVEVIKRDMLRELATGIIDPWMFWCVNDMPAQASETHLRDLKVARAAIVVIARPWEVRQ